MKECNCKYAYSCKLSPEKCNVPEDMKNFDPYGHLFTGETYKEFQDRVSKDK